ncbi:membrane protein [Sulfuricaulis limicola]|uniref:methanethiol S-methyltransferase n=1 Tax=Sulfuricaulis limicola TaxID=1620215 RepID=A0A1B4XHD4_9GAMM|nr:methanethiol S-methyltransferase [Sulfuricaulis limicola]BAV34199.1 membrane protein [Sulfuricaulis limicola]
MKRIAAFTYGVICYAIFFGTFLYAVGFVGNFIVPKSIDSTPAGPLGEALLINALLLGLFAVQHSVMARPAFKRWWTRFVPKPVERSTYVLFSSLALIALFAHWQPIGGVIWDVQNPVGRDVLYGLCAFGWGLVLVATYLINHFDLFGLRQVWLYLRGKEYRPVNFGTPALYKIVRHPLYVGFIFAFWATPTMTAAHLFFALMTTVYILIAIRLEERDLVAEHGARYVEYRKQVPMLVPRLGGRPSGIDSEAA